MLIEATRPLLLRLGGRDIHMRPGVPIYVPDAQGERVLEKAAGKVRPVPPINGLAWLMAWREVASVTDGVMPGSARWVAVQAALSRCDEAFEAGDLEGLRRAGTELRAIVEGQPP